MSLLDDIEKELTQISPPPWTLQPLNLNKVLDTNGYFVAYDLSDNPSDIKFIAAAPERIKLLVDFARASLALCRELKRLSGLDLSDERHATQAERKFIAARKALKLLEE